MAELTQRLGFEASQAIATLGSLQQALRGVNTQLRGMNRATQAQNQTKVIQGFAQTSNAAKQTATQVGATGKALDDTGRKGAQAAQNITLSWQTMLRVIQTQLIVRTLNAIVQGFGEAADAAAEFQLLMAQTAVIADGAGGSFESLTAQTRALSAEIGRPLQEVSEATFEAMQRGLGDVQQSFDLLQGSAHELALVTRGDLFTAMQVTSDIINAYGLNMDAAADISDVFFVTVDKGNVTLDEFRNRLGQITPLTANLGVGFDEMGAAIAAMTRQGLDGATAQTQLRNVLQKMLRPTGELKDAFRELGVASGEELIEATGGLVPALQQLLGTVNGNTTALAAMFGRIRASLGVLNLLSNEAELFNSIMGEMENRFGRAGEAAQEIEQIDAREAARQMEQLNKTINELGDTALNVRTSVVSMLNSVISDGEDAKVVFGGIAVALTAMGVQAARSAASVAVLRASFAGLGSAAAISLAAIAGVGIGRLINHFLELEDAALQAHLTQKNSLEELNKEAERIARTQTAELQKEISEREKLVQQYVNTSRQAYADEFKAFSDRSRLIIASQDRVFSNLRSQLQNASAAVEDFAANMQSALQSAADEVSTAQQNLEDFQFDRSLQGLNARQQSFALNDEAASRLRDALDNLSDADESGNQEARDRARAEIDAALAMNERARRAAEAAGVTQQVTEADNRHEQALQALADSAGTNYEAIEAAAKQASDVEIASTLATIDVLDQLLKKRQELLTESQGLLSPEAQQKIQQELQQNAEDFADTLQQATSSELLKSLNLSDPLQQAVLDAAAALDELEVQGRMNIANLQEQLNQARLTAPVAAALGAATGSTPVDAALARGRQAAGQFATGGQVVQQQVKALQDLQAENDANTRAFEAQGRVIQSNTDGIERMLDLGGSFNRGLRDFDAAQAVRNQIEAVSQQVPQATESVLTQLENQIGQANLQLSSLTLPPEIQAQLQASIGATIKNIRARDRQLQVEPVLSPQAEQILRQRLQDLDLKLEFGEELGIDPDAFAPLEAGAQESFQQIESGAATTSTNMQTGFQTASTNSGTAIAGIQGPINSINAGPAINQMNQLAAAARRALALASAAAGGGGAGFAHFGKVAYRAQGGPVGRGQDTQLVAMQPGESVINRRSSQQFFSQLRAINAGQAPQFREQGGPVTTVGDINVSIHAPDQASALDARTLAAGIRREVRRGQSIL